MDRLEPVLKQKFWILLTLGLILTVTGWWMATTALAKSITDRTLAIDSSFKTVESNASRSEIPNESWAKRLSVINTDQSTSIEATKLSMWKRQRERMTLPEGMADPGYWGKFSNQEREVFRESYEDEVRKVWKVVNPLNRNDGSGIVDYPLQNMYVVLKNRSWEGAPPNSEAIWNIREDMWLLESLFQAITAVNGGYDVGRGDASIHQIDRLELRGGGDKKSDSSGNSASSAAAADQGAMGGMPPMMMGGMRNNPDRGIGGGAGGMMGIADGLKSVPVEFDPAEEFGDDGSTSAAGGGMPLGFGAGGLPATGNAAATPAAETKRYLVTDQNLPFKKRGFYISLKMDHTKIPLLIAELTANERSVWPMEIMRVQMSRLNEDDSVGGGQRPGRMSGLGAGGMAAGGINPFQAGADGEGGPTGGAAGVNPFGDAAGDRWGVKPGVPGELHAMAMKAAFENALRDPVMAQVTICGAITLFKEVKEPEKPAPAVTTPEEVETKSPSTEESPTGDTEPPMDAATAESTEPAEPAAEMSASGDSEEKTESGKKPASEEPKSEAGEPK